MWTTDGNLTVHLYTSTDGLTWSSGQLCSAPWDTWNGGYIPWHIAAKPNNIDQKIEFLIAGWPKQGAMKDCQLLYATAPMSQPKELSMPLQDHYLDLVPVINGTMVIFTGVVLFGNLEMHLNSVSGILPARRKKLGISDTQKEP